MNEMNEVRKPPVATTGIIGWLRLNLFFNCTNSLITLIVIYCLNVLHSMIFRDFYVEFI